MIAPPEARPNVASEGSMDEAGRRLQQKGFIGTFSVLGIGRMKCGSCHAELDAKEVRLLETARIDVNTDPEDQSVVAGLECPRCEARATYVFSYGPSASAEDKSCFAALMNLRPRPA